MSRNKKVNRGNAQDNPYAWARATHGPQVFLEGSGSHLNPVDTPLQDAELEPAREGEHFLPALIVGVLGRRWLP